jgi:hypothetical protein
MTGDRGFESGLLQRRVGCELDSWIMVGADGLVDQMIPLLGKSRGLVVRQVKVHGLDMGSRSSVTKGARPVGNGGMRGSVSRMGHGEESGQAALCRPPGSRAEVIRGMVN